ncbi:alpha/beta hydrolase [Pseudonocardia sp. CA-107938]|uniref:alpha/beta hydrolase n=1 Tax=Pseudonocardia sp. CA-107938 TaxID=3240021 RepID=UPI003D930C4A
MPLDPACRDVLGILAASGAPPLDELPLPEARAAYDQLAAFAGAPAPVASTEDVSAGGVPARLYRPEGEGPHPVLIFLHGGGWVLGSAAGYDTVARGLCAGAGAIVVSVDYRLAPEHPFPAAVDDVRTAALWVRATAASLGGDPARLAVAGDSAGGNLAAVLANELPGTFALQVLLYPGTDLTMSHPSVVENGEGYLLTRAAMTWFTDQYVGQLDRRNPRVSPLYAAEETLAAAPPALIITAEFDPLRDEGTAYAARLAAAGVPVEHTSYPGMIHAFFALGGLVPAAERARDQVCAALDRAWNRAPAASA